MRIALDYTPAIAQSAGIARYTRELAAALARTDTANHYTLFSAEAPAGQSLPYAPNLRARIVPLGNRTMTRLWQRLRIPLPIELFVGPADVVHGPDFILPPVLGARRVVTIHDLAYLTHPHCALPSLVAYLTAVVPRALRAADRVIAVSQRTADDLAERLAVPREKIRVIRLGISPTFTPHVDASAVEALRDRYRLRGPLVLAVGTLEPRKNYETLIAAFAKARHTPGGPAMLAIAGHPGWLYEGVYAAAQTHQLGDAIRFLDHVPENELAMLYAAADTLAMPSLYEGFGIPVLEAMACGTPVVCSTGGALPEVAGDAALLISPEDTTGLAEALIRVVRDDELRATLRRRGLEHAAGFTWDAAARAHVIVYEEAARMRARRYVTSAPRC